MVTTAVNRPVDPKQKEEDVNTKIHLYGIYHAFSKGKLPSNKQIDIALNSTLDWKLLKNPSKKLSTDGQLLVSDVRDVIDKAKILLLTKNDGNLIQDFLWHTHQFAVANEANGGSTPAEKAAIQHREQEVKRGLHKLGHLIITNGQFRKLLTDASILIQDVSADAAQYVANELKPSDQELAQMEHAAADNTWHEAPDFSKKNLKPKFQSTAATGKKDIHAAGTKEKVTQKASQKSSTGAGDDKELREYRERANKYINSLMLRDRREQIVYRLKKMIVEIQGHKDYQHAVDTLLHLADEYTIEAKKEAVEKEQIIQGFFKRNPSVPVNIKTLLERFANGTSFDDLTDSIDEVYNHADNDAELKRWFKKLHAFIRRCIDEQGYVLEEASTTEWYRIQDEGTYLLNDRYQASINRVVAEFRFLADQFGQDPLNKAFGESVDKLFRNLGDNAQGKSTFKPQLLKDVTEVILPAIFEDIRYVPIPRIEFSDPMIDVVVENVVIEGDNLAPNIFEFGSDNYWRWGRKAIQNKSKNKVMLSASGIQMDLRDVAYYVKKKDGFPSLTDKGIMDVFLGGSGLSFKVAMETADKHDKQHFFKVNKVNVDVKHLDIKLKQSNHKLLFAFFKPLLFSIMKPAIERVVEKHIRAKLLQADAFLYSVKKEADREREEAKTNREIGEDENEFHRYFTAFHTKLREAQRKEKEQTKDIKVNVALTDNELMFKNIQFPGGITAKTTEYKELAEKGNKWETPVFLIGSARESSNLPAKTTVAHKQHNINAVPVGNNPQFNVNGAPVTNGRAHNGTLRTAPSGK